MKKSHGLVLEHFEHISATVFEVYQHIIRDFIRGRHGVYALYRGDRLYYVGLASNMRNRLKSHLKDRHTGLWNRFSIYLVADNSYMKDLESLLLRVVRPTGNRVKGKLRGSRDLRRELVNGVKSYQATQLSDMLGRAPRVKVTKHAIRDGELPLKGVFSRSRLIRSEYKDKRVTGRIRADGHLSVRGNLFDSPSAAARFITKKPCNGWAFWLYKHGTGDWRRLRTLRK
jgi:hypothetical protein